MAQPKKNQSPSEQAKAQKAAARAALRAQKPSYRFLYRIPYSTGLIISLVLLLVAVVVGNARTLQKLTTQAEKTLDVGVYLEGKVAQTSNLLVLAERYIDYVPPEQIFTTEAARDNVGKAKGVHALSMANVSLDDMTALLYQYLIKVPTLTEEDRQLAKGAMTSFFELSGKLRQQARHYNREAEHALTIYRSLPAHWILPAPQLFEGVD